MKPGSSDRCTNRTETLIADKPVRLRCHLRGNHAGSPHQAPRGKTTVYWPVETVETAAAS